MYKIKTLSNSFVVQEYNMNSKLVRQFGLKKGAATYKVENNLLKLYYYNDWFYKQPIASMDLPVEVDGIMYSANSISQGLKNIFKSSSSGGGDEAIVVDTELNTESANPIANAPVAIAINSIDNAHQEAIQTLQSNIDVEATRATNAETTLQTAISNEVSNRQTADGVLNDRITAANTNISENYYRKTEVDSKIDGIVAGDTSLQNYYTKAESDSNYQPKGNYALSGDSYTKQESNERYMKVGDVPTDVYTKTQVDDKLSKKLDISDYAPYDDTQVKADIAKKADKSYADTELAKKQDKGNYVSATTLNDYALKSEIPSVEGLATESYVSNKIKEVVGTAPEALDTLGEIADKLSGDDDAIAAINQVLKGKVSKDVYSTNLSTIYSSLTYLNDNKALKSEIPTIPLFKTINGQAITGSTDNIVIDTDLTDYYTKTESDNKYALKDSIPTDVYTKTQVDDKLSEKLDVSAYTPYDDTQVKADIQANTTAIAGKQDKGNYALSGTSYTKAESDAKVESLQNQLNALQELIATLGVVDDVYVNGKSVVADKIAYISMYTKEEVDEMIANVSFIVTRYGNTINITSNSSYVNDGTLIMNTSRAREDNNTLYFS